MLRLPVISVVIISMLVSSNPVLPNAVGQINAIENSTTVPTKIAATTSSVNNNNSLAVTPANPVESQKESANVTKPTASPKVDTVADTTPQRVANSNETEEHKKCSSTKESEDMRKCYATPSDSGENVDDNGRENATETTIVASVATKKAEVNKIESTTPKPSPEKPKEKENNNNNNKKEVTEDNIKNTTVSIVPLIPTKSTNQVTYDVVPTVASHEQNTNVTGNNTKSTTVAQPVAVDNATVSTNTVEPLVTDKGTNVEPEDVVAQVKSADRNKHMPSGVIALITAMSFGVAIAIVYIGMIVWRRYVEYRYGHRELLVNELEFDTNDLRHFEL
ncbi:uncharacterized protein LOC144468032 [Augochlora pura]